MTSYPPPGPPQGEPGAGQPPGGYQPPPNYGQPGGQYAPPPQGQQYPPNQQYGQYGGPQSEQPTPAKATFDFNSVDKLDWAIMGAGLLALIFSFFGYYHYGPKGATKSDCQHLPPGLGGAIKDFCDGTNTGAWHGFFGWFGVLLAVVGAAVVAITVFAPTVKFPVSSRLIAAGAFALSLLFTLLAIVVIPNYDFGVNISGSQYDKGVDEGLSFSYWIVLVLVVIGLVLSLLRFRQTGGDFAAVFSGGSKKQSTGVYGPPQEYPPPQAYQQQAPSSYQSPPAYQQEGYQPQPPPGGYQPPAGYQPPPPQQPGYQPPAPQQPGYPPPPGDPPPPGYPPPPPPPPSEQPPPPPPQG